MASAGAVRVDEDMKPAVCAKNAAQTQHGRNPTSMIALSREISVHAFLVEKILMRIFGSGIQLRDSSYREFDWVFSLII